MMRLKLLILPYMATPFTFVLRNAAFLLLFLQFGVAATPEYLWKLKPTSCQSAASTQISHPEELLEKAYSDTLRNFLELQKGYVEIPMGEEKIPLNLKTGSERMDSIAEMANSLLQDPKGALGFFRMFYGEVLKLQHPTYFRQHGYVEVSGSTHQLVLKMAEDLGWGKEIQIIHETLHPSDFAVEVLRTGKLWYDIEGSSRSHTGTAHLLQLLMITPLIDAKFGKGATRELVMFLGHHKFGIALWNFIFDRGPKYTRDLRGPRVYNLLNWATRNYSFFGLD